MCFDSACMSKHVSSTENALYNFLPEEYVRIPYFMEIQGCRVKTNTNVLEILNLDDEKSHIVRNYLVSYQLQFINLCPLVLRVCLRVYLPQRMYCTVFPGEYLFEYHILRKYSVAE